MEEGGRCRSIWSGANDHPSPSPPLHAPCCRVAAVCGGLCSCGTCHAYIDAEWQDKFRQTDSDEQDLLEEFDSTKNNSRLSCQLPLQAIHDGLKLSIAPED